MTYTAIHISYPSWENESPHFENREDAQAWLEKQKQKGDWGYVIEHK